jgi:hypothetical protein
MIAHLGDAKQLLQNLSVAKEKPTLQWLVCESLVADFEILKDYAGNTFWYEHVLDRELTYQIMCTLGYELIEAAQDFDSEKLERDRDNLQ